VTLELIPFDKHWAREIVRDGNASLEASCSNFDAIAPALEEAVDAHVALYMKTGASAPWIAYLARLPGTREIVGVCSFKDQCRAGSVEIAYQTFAPYRRRGFGHAMAEQLVDLALRHPDLLEVVAHTLPRESASTRILRGLNFRHAETVVDPDEGDVWRWVLTQTHSVAHDRRRYVPMTKASALLRFLA
jgi:[ribosomal protein S5]-alanine N-acetyltransferase